MPRLKNTFVQSIIWALALAVIAVAIDTIFCLVCPKSFLGFMPYSINSCLMIWAIDYVVSFIFIFVILFSQIFLGWTIALLILLVVGAAYLINWSTYLIVGEFLGIEGFKFTFYNFDQILWHMNQISPWYIVLLVIVIFSPLIIYALMYRSKNDPFRTNRPVGKFQTYASAFLFVLATLGFCKILTSFDKLPAALKIAVVSRTSPQLTLIFDRQKSDTAVTFEPGMRRLNAIRNKQESWDQYLRKTGASQPATPVILIVIESFRTDGVDMDLVMPNLYQLIRESISFKAWTMSNVTDYAWPSIFTSQYPLRSDYHYYYSKRVKYPRIAVYDVLKRLGYKNAIFSAQNEEWCGMVNAFNKESLDLLYSAEFADHGEQYVSKEDTAFASFTKQFKMAGKLDDSAVIEKTIAWISQVKTQKFFAGINFQRTHFPFTWPDSFAPPFPHGEKQKWFYPKSQLENMRGRYFNALRYTDEQIGKLIAFLKSQDLYDNSLIIITGDHGESFHEHNSTGHGNSLYNETALTPVVIKLPTGIERTIVKKDPELIDLAPSILEILKLPIHGSFQGKSLFSRSSTQTPVFITVNSPIAKQDAVIFDDWKLIKDHRNDQILLFDLKNDPAEAMNVVGSNPTKAQWLLYMLMTWRKEQLDYYADTFKQKNYYPPKFSIE